MPFSYYHKLSRAQRAVYRESDALGDVRLNHPEELHRLVARVEEEAAVTTASQLELF